MPKIYIPTALRQYAGDSEAVTLSGASVKEVLAGLTEKYPELKKHLLKLRLKIGS